MRKFNRKLENSIIENHHETLFFGGGGGWKDFESINSFDWWNSNQTKAGRPDAALG